MKTVYFIRHAKSSWSDMSLRDFDRPLNKRGKRDAPMMAQKLQEMGVSPDAILSSTANRAFTTATHFGKALGIARSEIIEAPSIYEAYYITVLKIVQNQPKKWDTILVFGHNPAFTTIANSFNGDYIDNVPTCGIVKVTADVENWDDFDEETAKVAAFYYPKQFL